MRKELYLFALICVGAAAIWFYSFATPIKEVLTQKVLSKDSQVVSTGSMHPIAPKQINSALKELATPTQVIVKKNHSSVVTSKQNIAKSICVKNQVLQKIDDQWENSIGSSFDVNGELLPENQYLESLDEEPLRSLAEQNYPAAMASLSIKLLNSGKQELIIKGREWAFKAAVHGKLKTLPYLSLSYFNEFQTLENTDQKESAQTALLNYYSSLLLFEDIAPGSSLGNEFLNITELAPTQKKALEKQTISLIQNYKKQRLQLGLTELTIKVAELAPEAEWEVCPQ